MRFLPEAQTAPPAVEEVPEAISAEQVESAKGASLFEKLQTLAIEIAPQYMRKAQIERIDALRPDHIPILLLRVQGHTHAEIAQILGCGTGTVYRVLRSVAGQELLTRMFVEAGMQAADVGRAFVEAAPMAADVLVELAQEGTKEETRLKAAFSILDRAGYGAVKKNESLHKVEVQTTTVSVRELDELRQALQEALEVEADFEVVEEEPAKDTEETE